MKAKLYWISMSAPWLPLDYSLVLFIEFIGLNMSLRTSRNLYEAFLDQWSGVGRKIVCSRSITAVLLLMLLGEVGVKRKV